MFYLSTLAPASMRKFLQVAPEMQRSLLCLSEIWMRDFHNSLWKCLLQTQQWTCSILCENIKAFSAMYCYYQKCHQVTQFLHSNVIFSECQMKEEYHYEAEDKFPAYAFSFHLHHPWRTRVTLGRESLTKWYLTRSQNSHASAKRWICLSSSRENQNRPQINFLRA